MNHTSTPVAAHRLSPGWSPEFAAAERTRERDLGLWIFEASPDCVKLLDADGNLLKMNRNGQCLMEVDDFRPLAGLEWAALWPAESRDTVAGSVAEARAGGTGRFQAFCPTAKGTPKWWDVTVTCVVDDEDTLRLLSVSRDITIIVEGHQQQQEHLARVNEELERRVAERTAELHDTMKELEALAYAFAHDLRAPLASINGFSKILAAIEGDRMGEGGGRYLAKIRAATVSMEQMIEGVLGLARLTPDEELHATVDVSQLAEDTVEVLRAQDPARTVNVSVQPGLKVHGDRAQIALALANLLGNAWKFTSHRSEAFIEVGASVGKTGEQEFYVRDNGAGFDPAYAHRLFKPFHRLHSQQEFGGTGIGLATVQKIVRLHKGRICAEGAVGHGATIRFTLAPATPSARLAL